MNLKFCNDNFWPYDSFDQIYTDRVLPEFGEVLSPYVKDLVTWRFFLANGVSGIPMDFEGKNFDDSDWALINTPSSWQLEGYGTPQNLLYDYPMLFEGDNKKSESASDKYVLNSTSNEDEEIGIYRTEVVFSPEDIDRAIYLAFEGIAGHFEVYINGTQIVDSGAVMTGKKVLLSDYAVAGTNVIAILIFRYDRDAKGRVVKELALHGLSGILRPIKLVFEPLLEISNMRMKLSSVPSTYVDMNATKPSVRDEEQQLIISQDDDSYGEIYEAGEGARGATRETVSKVSRGNFIVDIDLEIVNHTDLMMPYSVRVSILEARGQYDPYKLPIIKLTQEKEISGVIDSKTSIMSEAQVIAANVAQWSDATPVQYDLVLELLDSDGNTICAKKRRFGFRTTEVILDKLNINERRVPLTITKYYEFDPDMGVSVPLERMRQDIILMKRCGINTIMVQAFPASTKLLNLCDQYGIYVFALGYANIMYDYVEECTPHPSVVCYGFPPYSLDVNNATKVKNQCELLDNTRPWYSIEKKLSSFNPFPSEAGVIYGPWQDLCIRRSRLFDLNKLGVNLLSRIPGRGSYDDDDARYEWIHHADLEGGKERLESSIGQGIVDANRNPHPIYFDIKQQCSMVLIFADPMDPSTLTVRNTHPFSFTSDMRLDWKLMLGGYTIMSGDGLVREIEPYGTKTLRFPLDFAKFYDEGWAMGYDEKTKLSFAQIYDVALSHDLVFEVSLKLDKDGFYASKGHEITFFQERIMEDVARPLKANTNVVATAGELVSNVGNDYEQVNEASDATDITDITSIDDNVDADKASDSAEMEISLDEVGFDAINEEDIKSNGKFTYIGMPQGLIASNNLVQLGFDRKNGALSHIAFEKFDFLMGNMMPSFYRCPSNVDRTDKSFKLASTVFSKETNYEAIQESIEYKGSNYEEDAGVFSMISRYKSFAMKGEIIVMYELIDEKRLKVTLSFTPRYDMVRYGFRVPLKKSDILCSWYGRGPGESYTDRKNAARIGHYAAGADKLYHAYARPSENSSHVDTRAVKLESSTGNSIKITRFGGGTFEFAILPYTPEQMNNYLHQEQLMQNDYLELFLDFCTREVERTATNISNLPLKKNVAYKESFLFEFE